MAAIYELVWRLERLHRSNSSRKHHLKFHGSKKHSQPLEGCKLSDQWQFLMRLRPSLTPNMVLFQKVTKGVQDRVSVVPIILLWTEIGKVHLFFYLPSSHTQVLFYSEVNTKLTKLNSSWVTKFCFYTI